jgi:5-hydroxyisourate hydrolase
MAANGRLTTHVLDTARGKPAKGMRIELHRIEHGIGKRKIAEATTDDDGRTAQPLLVGDALTAGTYRLLFHVGDYFAATGSADARVFLDVVPILFRVEDASAKYHVPLLVSPWAYSTYRGS